MLEYIELRAQAGLGGREKMIISDTIRLYDDEDFSEDYPTSKVLEAVAYTFGINSDRLRAIAEAERDERVVVLPCKTGEQAWCLRNYSGTVHARCGIVSEVKYSDYCGINVVVFNVGRGKWGEKVFSTYAEAARALTEPKGGLDGK